MIINKAAKIELCASGDQTRAHMCNPYLDVANKCLVTTDGHRLVKLPVETEDGDTSGFISPAALKAARKLAPKGQPVSIKANGALLLADGSSLPRPTEDYGSFPPYAKVLPNYDNQTTVSVCLDARYLYEIVQALGGSKHEARVKLTFGTDHMSPIQVEIGTSEGIAVLMPCRDNS